VRYFVRDSAGQELSVPSLDDLHRLYQQGFLTDDDLVRKESGERWERLGRMEAMGGARRRRAGPRWVYAVLLGGVLLAMAVGLMLAGRPPGR
jgi:hypothetical protein